MTDREANRFSARAARYARVGANMSGVAARIAGAVRRAAQNPPPRITRRHCTDIGADARVARGAGGEAVLFAVGHECSRFLMLLKHDPEKHYANEPNSRAVGACIDPAAN